MTAPPGRPLVDATRATLDKAAAENFPVAPAFLPRAWRTGLTTVYGYARLVDDIGDGDLAPDGPDAALLGRPDVHTAAGDPTGSDADTAGARLALLDALEADLDRVFEPAGRPLHPLVAALRPVVAAHHLGPEPFRALIEANRQDQRVRRYETHEDLRAYCALSADPVGRLVLGLTDTLTPERVRLSDLICTALQIVEHLQDVAEDLRRDRIYLPAEDLDRFHVTENALAAPTAGASVRALIAFECARARALLNEGTPLVGSVHGRLRLLLAGFVGGGHAALDAIAAAGFDVLPGAPKPTKPGLLREVAAVLRSAPRKG
ncbi:squalene synthase HpnC [Streptomyces sp. BI20]|uniref:squalene synthase HpnC n=1 Tax=Streptomyces sp. BI20 TaxID=3403460 RepID=UPI003C75A77B